MTGLLPSHRIPGPWTAVVCLLFTWAAVSEVFDIGYWKRHRTLNYDIETYYHYLPATFIHGDPIDLGYVAALDSLTLHPGEGQLAHGVRRISATGRDVLKVTCGVALLELPFFLVAHAYCALFDPTIADGYSAPYQLMVSLSAVCSTLLGLLVLAVFLRRYTHDRAIACALLVLGLGTNLFFYSSVDSGMPHSYLFLLFSVVLERTDAWYRMPTAGKAVMLGIAMGLIVLIRPLDIVVALIPLLWPCYGKLKLLRGHAVHVVVLLVFAFLPVLPQIAYWKAATGQWLYWSYEGEGFDLRAPHILEGLFSYRKGWFVYSPLVLLGFIGMIWMLGRRDRRPFAWPIVVYFALSIYFVFSWTTWWYGGGFGCRPMVGPLALLALPMALLAETVIDRSRMASFVLMVTVVAGVHLNQFQQDQYLQTILHWDGMTRERYWEIWGHATWDGLEEFP